MVLEGMGRAKVNSLACLSTVWTYSLFHLSCSAGRYVSICGVPLPVVNESAVHLCTVKVRSGVRSSFLAR